MQNPTKREPFEDGIPTDLAVLIGTVQCEAGMAIARRHGATYAEADLEIRGDELLCTIRATFPPVPDFIRISFEAPIEFEI